MRVLGHVNPAGGCGLRVLGLMPSMEGGQIRDNTKGFKTTRRKCAGTPRNGSPHQTLRRPTNAPLAEVLNSANRVCLFHVKRATTD